ncbi:MAG: DUF5104 domain-containing protein [Mogibacterium diversum]|uniref:DUF5104 domain-containing protein n=1 Tax=Mogibacterium diversum TaxID=114527 RepID=UPI001CAC55E1|nr:DUF5104 domain-containing protein [Mogibacterium diversum]MBF1341389.1 DUF5104 domain-containing protein [Mogibacterium diversum]MBF1359467.1 DUF5104 domain-containing protein [Mogibacterium diversum]
MRKLTCAFLCLLMILSIAFCLTGCKSRTDEMAGLEAHTDKQINKMKKQVIKCINKQDKEGLKKLFSKDAQKHIDDLDGKLDQLIGAFNGNKIKSAKGSGTDFEGSADAQPLHIYGDYSLKLINGEKYVIMINICDIDDDNKEKEGLYQITLMTFSKDAAPEEFYIETNDDDYGIFIYKKDGIQQ